MKFKRRSIRLLEYDYTEIGAYFIAVCTNRKSHMFGKIINDAMQLNQFGEIVNDCWCDIPEHFLHVELDRYVIMPNHFHGIVIISRRGTACRAPTFERFGKPIRSSIPTIIRSFKSAVTYKINKHKYPFKYKIWQRNYFERVIGDDWELNLTREYIMNNVAEWESDENFTK